MFEKLTLEGLEYRADKGDLIALALLRSVKLGDGVVRVCRYVVERNNGRTVLYDMLDGERAGMVAVNASPLDAASRICSISFVRRSLDEW